MCSPQTSRFFYEYDETIACKGADEVSSFLFHFVMFKLDRAVKELDIFVIDVVVKIKTGHSFDLFTILSTM